jgi:hypothetical protein
MTEEVSKFIYIIIQSLIELSEVSCEYNTLKLFNVSNLLCREYRAFDKRSRKA